MAQTPPLGPKPHEQLTLRRLHAVAWFAAGAKFEVRDANGAVHYRTRFHILKSMLGFNLDLLDTGGQAVLALHSTQPFNGRATGPPLMGWSVQRKGQPDIAIENRLLGGEQEIVLTAEQNVLLRAHAGWPNHEYSITDASGTQVAHVTREGKGLATTTTLDVLAAPGERGPMDEPLLVAVSLLTDLLNQWHYE